MMDLLRRILLKLRGGVWTIRPKGTPRGRVLLSYTTLPFISPKSLGGHSNRWECRKMAEIWAKKGFVVDIVDFDNETFIPQQRYDYCIDNSHHLEKFSPLLGGRCIKIFHIPASHWKFQNDAERKRIGDIERRRGIKLKERRPAMPSKNIEAADIAVTLGGAFSTSTYAYTGKNIVRVPVASAWTVPFPEGKDFSKARTSYVWMGGAGMAHKGLDLVLEAFARMPDLKLTVFGKKDPDFAEAYQKELFETQNIRYAGLVDPGSAEFRSVVDGALATVFPSCSEGASTSVIDLMHSGLIPVVSREASVDTEDFGVILKENASEEIEREVRKLASSDPGELKTRARKAWIYANTNHTQGSFSERYERFVEDVISGKIPR